jgi:phenylalanyl-tRNA synthetase alpha chain
MAELSGLKKKALTDIAAAADLEALEGVRVGYLGRKGEVTEILRSLKDVPLEERRRKGPEANALRKDIASALDARMNELKKGASAVARFDVTKPGHRPLRGHLHPLTKLEDEVRRIFASMNFSVVEGPEVESARYNFDALNIPANHPARDMWDTFWLTNDKTRRESSAIGHDLLLRTHTSPMQVRYMETHEPPLQIIVPGRVFRYEATDASHQFNFYQVEGLMVGPDVTLANFKFVIEKFYEKLFGSGIEFRFRPSFFPFTEPSVEVDIKLKGGKWLEMMGAGMVNRNVFDAVRYNPDKVQGFAFGMGLDRLAMVKYGIPDIRLLYSGDVRFTRRF